MKKEYAIWGVPEGGSSEELLVAMPEGRPITSRGEAETFVKLLEKKYGARSLRIQEIDLEGQFDWMKTLSIESNA